MRSHVRKHTRLGASMATPGSGGAVAPPEFEEQQRRAVEGEKVGTGFEGGNAPVDFRFNVGFGDAWPEPGRRHREDMALACHQVGNCCDVHKLTTSPTLCVVVTERKIEASRAVVGHACDVAIQATSTAKGVPLPVGNRYAQQRGR